MINFRGVTVRQKIVDCSVNTFLSLSSLIGIYLMASVIYSVALKHVTFGHR